MVGRLWDRWYVLNMNVEVTWRRRSSCEAAWRTRSWWGPWVTGRLTRPWWCRSVQTPHRGISWTRQHTTPRDCYVWVVMWPTLTTRRLFIKNALQRMSVAKFLRLVLPENWQVMVQNELQRDIPRWCTWSSCQSASHDPLWKKCLGRG